jgi:hypothetical protein
MLKKIVLILTAALFMPFAIAQDLDYGEGEFTANFDIDSAHTTDGTNYKISATGEAGPYGRVWLSYEFTDKLGLGDSGEFTGFAWTQNGEQFATATLAGRLSPRGQGIQDVLTGHGVGRGDQYCLGRSRLRGQNDDV